MGDTVEEDAAARRARLKALRAAADAKPIGHGSAAAEAPVAALPKTNLPIPLDGPSTSQPAGGFYSDPMAQYEASGMPVESRIPRDRWDRRDRRDRRVLLCLRPPDRRGSGRGRGFHPRLPGRDSGTRRRRRAGRRRPWTSRVREWRRPRSQARPRRSKHGRVRLEIHGRRPVATSDDDAPMTTSFDGGFFFTAVERRRAVVANRSVRA